MKEENSILMCEEHNIPLVHGLCVECGCILDMQSTYILQSTKPRGYSYDSTTRGTLTEYKEYHLTKWLLELSPGTALKLERLQEDMGFTEWKDLVAFVRAFLGAHTEFELLAHSGLVIGHDA